MPRQTSFFLEASIYSFIYKKTKKNKQFTITNKKGGFWTCRNLYKLTVCCLRNGACKQTHLKTNEYFMQGLRHSVDVGVDLGIRRRSDLTVEGFSRHEARELVVANYRGHWIRNHPRITSQLSVSRAEDQEFSTSFPDLHRVVVYTTCVECTVPLLLSSGKKQNLGLLRQNTDLTVSPKCHVPFFHYIRTTQKGSASTTNRLRHSLDADESMNQGQRCPKTKYFAVESM